MPPVRAIKRGCRLEAVICTLGYFSASLHVDGFASENLGAGDVMRLGVMSTQICDLNPLNFTQAAHAQIALGNVEDGMLLGLSISAYR
jgi:hypothetical protein